MANITIEGVQYERELLVLATEHTTGKDQEMLCKDGIKEIFSYVLGSENVTDIKMRTLDFICETLPFSDEAKQDFEDALAKLKSAEVSVG